MRILVPAISVALVAAPASAMTVQAFLDKADALKAKGMMAMFSSDLGPVKAEITGAMKGWRTQAATARPPVCPPPRGSRLNSDEILAMLRAIPPADRARLSVTQGMHQQLNARYRCR